MKVVFIHGKDADPSAKSWYVWLKNELDKRKIKSFFPQLPNSVDPDVGEWICEIENLNPDEETILIGHSRGGMAILRWLEEAPKNKKVGKVILIAANNPGVDEKNQKKRHKRIL
ncbi:alpha/beta fold hydrolase [Candidatus Pacearchaeota archaeon]|nr:alpha/beta fold hydrolase [Candidatus Pacearchaeota archaeon]